MPSVFCAKVISYFLLSCIIGFILGSRLRFDRPNSLFAKTQSSFLYFIFFQAIRQEFVVSGPGNKKDEQDLKTITTIISDEVAATSDNSNVAANNSDTSKTDATLR